MQSRGGGGGLINQKVHGGNIFFAPELNSCNPRTRTKPLLRSDDKRVKSLFSRCDPLDSNSAN